MAIDSLLKYCVFLIKSCRDEINVLNDPKHFSSSHEEEKRAMFIIVNSWIAVESFLNLIISLSKYASKLDAHERDFLEEKVYVLDENGKFQTKKMYNKTSEKIVYLLNKFSSVDVIKFRNTRKWSDIKQAEVIRNSLIHPKSETDFIILEKKQVNFVYMSSLEMIKFLNTKIYRNRAISKLL